MVMKQLRVVPDEIKLFTEVDHIKLIKPTFTGQNKGNKTIALAILLTSLT